MVWPETLTTDLDLPTFGQGAHRLLESGQNYVESHKEASKRVRGLLKQVHGVDADQVTNITDYKAAAAYHVFALALLTKNKALSDQFDTNCYRSVRDTFPVTGAATGHEGGGGLAPISLHKSGARNARGAGAPLRYRQGPPGARYGGA